MVRDAFPSAQFPAHLRVNGRLLTSMLQLHYYCPLVRALPAMPPAETASLDFLDSSALPVEEVVNCFPGLSVDLQRARASSTTSTTTWSSCFVADLASTTSTTSTTLPGSAVSRSARVASSDSPALSQASASIDAVDSSYTVGVALAAPGFAGVSPTAPSRRCVLTCIDGVPLRFFLSSPAGHVEALTLSGSLPVEDVLTQLCWQLTGSSVLFNDVQLLACDRAFVDADFGLSIFIASHVASASEHAWLDFDPAFHLPSVIRLPFLLSASSLAALCPQGLPSSSHVAISGTPWNGRPYQLQHSDVVVVRASASLLFSLPLPAIEARVDGISMLLVHQLGPGPRPPLQLLDGEWHTLPQAPPHDYSSLRAFWSCTRLGWPIHLARDFPYQRCLLVGLDIPPLVVASGTRWAPQDFDINLFYRTHLSDYFGERRWRDSGLVYGDLYVMFDRAIDSTARRPWLLAAETFVDVILGAADGSDLGNWPCPSGWSVRPVHTWVALVTQLSSVLRLPCPSCFILILLGGLLWRSLATLLSLCSRMQRLIPLRMCLYLRRVIPRQLMRGPSQALLRRSTLRML